jgi:hypothetical protein
MEAIPHIAFTPHRCCVNGCSERAYRAERCPAHYQEYQERPIARSTWFVYAIKAPNNLIKIGRSKNPSERLDALQIGSPVKLELLAWTEAKWSLEEKLHKLLIASRSHGEWFRPDDKVLQVVELIADQRADLLEGLTARRD